MGRRSRLFIGILLVLGLLTACGPPPELSGRPLTPPDVAARALLPPGEVAQVAADGAVEAAAVRTPDGGRFSAFRLATAGQAADAFARWRDRRLAQPDVRSSQAVGVGALHFARYSGDGVRGLGWVSGTWFFIAQASNESSLTALIAASRAGGVGDPGWAGSPATIVALVFGIAAAVLLVVATLARLALRRLAVAPAPGVAAVERSVLEERLLSLNRPERPWLVRHDAGADLVVEWKFADAAWWGVLAKSGLRKSYRLRLYLDERGHRCGALDEFGEVEWSAGAIGSARVTFQRNFFRGVQLMRKERGIAYGFKTPAGGGAGKVLDYTFDIDALKQPVIEAVTQAGWTYQPVLWPKRRG